MGWIQVQEWRGRELAPGLLCNFVLLQDSHEFYHTHLPRLLAELVDLHSRYSNDDPPRFSPHLCSEYVRVAGSLSANCGPKPSFLFSPHIPLLYFVVMYGDEFALDLDVTVYVFSLLPQLNFLLFGSCSDSMVFCILLFLRRHVLLRQLKFIHIAVSLFDFG